MPSFRTTLRYLYGLEAFGIRPGLKRIRRALKRLGDPHLAYPSVLIAGTNGKGSTASMLAAILEEAGLKTGLYTSPHLTRLTERIRVNRKEIPAKDVTRITEELRSSGKAVDGEELTFFEFLTVMAFQYFSDKAVDVAVVEVGMGGRLDATNVLNPMLSIVTNVGKDHCRVLGSSLREIALEKAGIIQRGGVVVVGVEGGIALSTIKGVASKRGASTYVAGKDFFVHQPGKDERSANPRKFDCSGRLDYHGEGAALKGLTVSLPGLHQLKNAACALKAVELLNKKGFEIKRNAIRGGLKKVAWPGRLEILKKKPMVILDCAHNEEGANALGEALRSMKFKRLVLILGIMADKDIGSIVRRLTPLASTVILTEPDYKRSADVETLGGCISGFTGKVVVRRKVSGACKEALMEAGSGDAVCVTGSIFTVAEARRYLKRYL